MNFKYDFSILFLALIMLSACSVSIDNNGVQTDTLEPYPIHVDGNNSDAPLTYKGLDLELTDNGTPAINSENEVIGMVCIGMSNAAQECNRYILAITTVFADEVSSNIKVVNCARGSHAIERWNDPEFDDALWNRCTDLIAEAELSKSDIQIVLHKAANQFTFGPNQQPLPYYPNPESDFFTFKENLSIFSVRVTNFFPDLQAVFTTSRSYGGYTDRPERGEPLSYEEGHALNQWLLENPSVNDVWFGWGPYIWAPDCSTGITNGLGFCYERSDYSPDAVHPSSTGEVKVARMWHQKLSEYEWYRN